jgi:hypothetical protein
MNTGLIRHILRAILILLVQVLVLKRISLGSDWLWQHGQIFLYPVIVLLLPFTVPRQYVILIGFFTGLVVDIFYDTIGVHAFALTAAAYVRGLTLHLLEPRGGYQTAMHPVRYSMGLNWLVTYTSIVLGVHVFLYFVAEIFTFVYLGKIMFNTLMTFVLSLLVIMGYHLLFNPRR